MTSLKSWVIELRDKAVRADRLLGSIKCLVSAEEFSDIERDLVGRVFELGKNLMIEKLESEFLLMCPDISKSDIEAFIGECRQAPSTPKKLH